MKNRKKNNTYEVYTFSQYITVVTVEEYSFHSWHTVIHVAFILFQFLAHLSRRLIGELIVYRSSRRPCVRPSVRASVHIFKHEYLCNQLVDWNEILSEASLGWGKGFNRF